MALQHSSTIPSHPQANLSGWFERHTSIWPIRRWLELRGPTLTYRNSRTSAPQWTVDLRECRIAAGSRARELVLERPSAPPLSIFAPSLAELKLWFTELKRVSDVSLHSHHLSFLLLFFTFSVTSFNSYSSQPAFVYYFLLLSLLYFIANQLLLFFPSFPPRYYKLFLTTSQGIHDFYYLAAQISHSAHGPIVLAREKATDEQAAVFLQRKSEMSAWTMWALTRRDARVLRLSQTHSATVAVRDVFETTRVFYVVTELVTGGPLRDAIARAPSAVGAVVARSVASDVLRALAHLHSGGVVHGSVDAAHVLCVGGLPGRVKLVVFGVAAGVREAGAFGRGAGEIGDAPEVICYRRRSSASDIFSTGVMIFSLLTGASPFATGSEDEYLGSVSHGPVGANWDKLGAARSLLERMMSDEPGRRPSAVECLKHEWFDGVSGGRGHGSPLARWGSDPKTVIMDFETGVGRGERQERVPVAEEVDINEFDGNIFGSDEL